MKKLLVAAFAAVLSVALVVPASALENVAGGYWRTRAFTQQDFAGSGSDAKDITRVDTRTRLYYTAKINDNLKLVNKFEFNTVWGDNNGGDWGTDGTGHIRVKQSYADFNWMDINFKIGMQPLVLQRGFLIDSDFAGAVITYKNGPFTLPFVWAKIDEGHVDFAKQNDANDADMDMFVLYPQYAISDSMTVKFLLAYMTQDKEFVAGKDATHEVSPTTGEYVYIPATADTLTNNETDAFFVGVDFDAQFDALKLWFTGIYEGGEYKDQDIDAFLLAIGANYDFGDFELHSQAFMATGEESGSDKDAFTVPFSLSQSYYWAEIMGLGTFDNQASAASPADAISNVMAINLGASFQPMDKLTLGADLWYAQLEEDDVNGEDELGVEVDLKATYQLVEGLNLDVIAAYLFAGDATGGGDEDPYEIGTRLSLSF